MRLPVTKRVKEAESELNLPPGFRFHPTDEELIVHYLCRKSQSTKSEIIADVDIYKHEPWELPEMALFGTKEWYFFTPRDRKYPNGSRSNRVTGNGYWKATGADKPIKSKSDTNEIIGIKKAMVFFTGKGVKGIKTNWIMHEYRLVIPNPSPSKHTNATTSKLDDWILCRVYNKKNNPKEMIIGPEDNNIHHLHPASLLQKENSSCDNNSDSFQYSNGEFGGNFEGDAIFPGNLPLKSLSKLENRSKQSNVRSVKSFMQKDDLDDGNDWLNGLSLEDLHHYLEAMPPAHDLYGVPMTNNHQNQQHFSNCF